MPAIGGYEGVGEVYALGSAVSSLSVGDWVIPSPPSFGILVTYFIDVHLSLLLMKSPY